MTPCLSAFVSAGAPSSSSLHRHPIKSTTGLRVTSFTSGFAASRRADLPKGDEVTAGRGRMTTMMSAVSAETARVGMAIYGLLVAGGGIGAFVKSGSKMSIISGVVAGIVLAAAYVNESVPVALGTAAVLGVVFAVRLVKTKKFMPAGLLCILSVVAAAFFAAAIYA